MPFLNSYINFNGNCEQAFNLYKSVFGGEFSDISRFGDVPPGSPGMEGADPNKILHVSLPVGQHCMLMGSDCPPSFGTGTQGNLFNISITADSKEEADRLFNGLSAGGQVFMPMADSFWGSYFGMLTDPFGVQWMVSYEYPKS